MFLFAVVLLPTLGLSGGLLINFISVILLDAMGLQLIALESVYVVKLLF